MTKKQEAKEILAVYRSKILEAGQEFEHSKMTYERYKELMNMAEKIAIQDILDLNKPKHAKNCVCSACSKGNSEWMN
jgi:hypothetical protein